MGLFSPFSSKDSVRRERRWGQEVLLAYKEPFLGKGPQS